MNKTVLLIAILSLSLFAKTQYWVKKLPVWTVLQPSDETSIYGVGKARIEKDLESAKKSATDIAYKKLEEEALKVISEYVQEKSRKGIAHDKIFEFYREHIDSFIAGSLTHWKIAEIVASKKEQSCFVLVSADKTTIEKRLKLHLETCYTQALEAFEHSFTDTPESPYLHLNEGIKGLEKGLEALGRCWGIESPVQFQGEDILLSVEIPKRITELFSNLRLLPSQNEAVFALNGKLPNDFGVFLTCKDKAVIDIPLIWSVDKKVAIHENTIGRFHPIPLLDTIPSGLGLITFTVVPEIQHISERLLQFGVIVDKSAPITLQVLSDKRHLFSSGGEETPVFLHWLTTKGIAKVDSSAKSTGIELDLSMEIPVVIRGERRVSGTATLHVPEEERSIVVEATGVGRNGEEARAACRTLLFEQLLQQL